VTARSEVPSSFRSSSVRPGPLALIRLGITEALSRRRLIAYLVRADLRKTGADTLLGNVWWVVDPLLQMLVYWLLVGVILQRGNVPAFPLFIFAAILPWKWFESTMKDGTLAVVGQDRLIKQIYFPKLVLPVAASMSGVVNFAFGLIPLTLLMVVAYADKITPWLLLIPVIAIAQLVFTTGLAILASALNVFYRDVGNLLRHLMRFWFYLSPTLYGLNQVDEITKGHGLAAAWFKINPWTYILNSYRDVIYYGRAPEWTGLIVITLLSVLLVAFSIWVFKRVEPNFAKVL
jgi:lipopolysaccharide transport system permease protein/teichoic acid transport system permease protein